MGVECVLLHADQRLTSVQREAGGRGFVYVIADHVGRRALVVTQRLPLAASYLKDHVDDCKTSSLYDACLREGKLYRNRFKVVKLSLGECVDAIERERSAQHYDQHVVVGQPFRYRVTMRR